MALEFNMIELGEQALAQRLGGDAGAVGYKIHDAFFSHQITLQGQP